MPPKRGKGKTKGTATPAEKSSYPTFSSQSVRRFNEFAAAKNCAEWHDKASYKCVSSEVPDKYKSNEGDRERKTSLAQSKESKELRMAMPCPVPLMSSTSTTKTPRPTVIPLLAPTVWPNDTERQANQVAPAAIMLVHAVQILLFAPVEWEETISYSTNPEDYRHGYLILEGPDQTLVVGGRFSMEDLNRAIFLLYAFSNRRNGRVNLLQERAPRKSGKTRWSRYHDPTFIFLDEEPAAVDKLVDQVAIN
ncbi:hypothetical protein NM208_g6281 [Fusarium decemcellulare]|uniref:Uncharacterized protein n=2 Tax=Fusarium decemcellulare TaxID=57161 RepID=A0ACC1SCT3_9HYPO|nr:hypothetical protein NM208_g6497 [Fusarium decemcellulare]KAJ3537511.1 hypothetical protein NM208_g6281 [Fusarium decemcellulare]